MAPKRTRKDAAPKEQPAPKRSRRITTAKDKTPKSPKRLSRANTTSRSSRKEAEPVEQRSSTPTINLEGTPARISEPELIESRQNVSENDFTARLVLALEKTLNSVRDNSVSEGNERFVNRMTTAKSLPSFFGDPLEWSNFKDVYALSTELGKYSDRDNIARLFEALKRA